MSRWENLSTLVLVWLLQGLRYHCSSERVSVKDWEPQSKGPALGRMAILYYPW